MKLEECTPGALVIYDWREGPCIVLTAPHVVEVSIGLVFTTKMFCLEEDMIIPFVFDTQKQMLNMLRHHFTLLCSEK